MYTEIRANINIGYNLEKKHKQNKCKQSHFVEHKSFFLNWIFSYFLVEKEHHSHWLNH